FPDDIEHDAKNEEESPLFETIRSKCITQLLLLGAIDSIQKKYWNKLNAPQKISIMDILFSVLEFAATYNSYTNLRLRMHSIPVERPPLNLLRQEIVGTCVYLDVLQKTTAGVDPCREDSLQTNVPRDVDNATLTEHNEDQKLQGIAEEKLVSFCGQILREASDFQFSVGETTNMDIHRVLELRSPIIVKIKFLFSEWPLEILPISVLAVSKNAVQPPMPDGTRFISPEVPIRKMRIRL
ncbi:unnamed protein product, partial [Ilex paraguariensis]